MKCKTITFVKRRSNLLNTNREKQYNCTPKLDAATLAGVCVYEKNNARFQDEFGYGKYHFVSSRHGYFGLTVSRQNMNHGLTKLA